MKIIEGMADAPYRAIDALAQSRLSLMRKSPMHYQLNPQFSSDAMSFGSIFHLALLEPAKFKTSFLVEPTEVTIDGKTVELNKRIAKHRDWLDCWRTDNIASVILTEKQMDSLTGMLNEIQRDPMLVELIQMGKPECVVLFDHKGRACKGKADLLVDHPKHGRVVVDFKKTQDASESGFARSVHNYCYNLQSAFYLDGFQAQKFYFVAVEEKGFIDRQGVSRHPIGKWDAELFLDSGRALRDRLMDKLAECERTNEWPWYSFGKGAELLRPPAWMSSLQTEEE